MAAKTIQKLIQSILLLMTILLFVGCTVPGDYMGPLDVKEPLIDKGRLAYPDFKQINPDLLRQQKVVTTSYEYDIGPRDVLSVIVWNHPELTIPSMQTTSETVNITTSSPEINGTTTGILVDAHGKIFFPLAGEMKVKGLTMNEVHERITHNLTKYIRHPQVSVRVAAFRSKPVYVIGEVNKPGTQYITDIPLTIMDAINQAGGISTDSSDPRHIYVVRGDYQKPLVYWLDMSTPGAILMAEDFQLSSYDVIYIATAGISRWNRVISQILPTLQTVWYTRALMHN